jgi:hypothetical protein
MNESNINAIDDQNLLNSNLVSDKDETLMNF